jgi:hypothetical protein
MPLKKLYRRPEPYFTDVYTNSEFWVRLISVTRRQPPVQVSIRYNDTELDTEVSDAWVFNGYDGRWQRGDKYAASIEEVLASYGLEIDWEKT